MTPDRKPIIATLIFLGLLCLPLATQIASPRSQSETPSLENRTLAAFPSPDSALSNWSDYPASLEAWMKDHMGLRAPLIRLDVTARSTLRLSNRFNAVRGDDGWLFGALEGELEVHQGLRPYSKAQTDDWLNGAKKIRTRAEANGAVFAVMIAPNKHSIYSEHLSDYPVRMPEPRPAQSLAASAKAADITLLYPDAELIAAKASQHVYYRTDSHWTAQGAYIAYTQLIDTLARSGTQVIPASPDRLNLEGERTRKGDLWGLLGVPDAKPETVPRLNIRNAKSFASAPQPQYDWRSFKAYRQIIEGSDGPRVLVYGDSFFDLLVPFMRESFSDITYIHHHSGAPPLSAIDTGDYDVVLLIMVERGLYAPLEPQD